MITGHRLHRGLSLVECLLAIAILAGTVLAVTYTVVAANHQTRYADRAARAARLGRDLLEEIAARSYADPNQTPGFGTESGETQRTLFDDVDDYNGYQEAAGALKDAGGTLYATDDQVFSRAVTVAAASNTLGTLGSFAGLRVTVVVTHSSGETWTFVCFVPQPAS
jgi:MSHA pilin protein MshD